MLIHTLGVRFCFNTKIKATYSQLITTQIYSSFNSGTSKLKENGNCRPISVSIKNERFVEIVVHLSKVKIELKISVENDC